MATNKKEIQATIHALLTATRTAKETRAKLVAQHIEPANETIDGSMYKVIIVGYDLNEAEWGKVKEFLKDKEHSQGAINQIARFMSGNVGHNNLTSLLKGCTDETVEGRIKFLQDKHLTSYKKLYQACCPPSDDAVVNKIVKTIIGLSPELQQRVKITLEDKQKEGIKPPTTSTTTQASDLKKAA
tara:strand:- start:853 stop:1407 length:555 start_codon:yes stop_codon:yes gene_type:complete